VPTQRIFTVNPGGEIKAEMVTTYKSTYYDLNDLFNQMFPPINAVDKEVKEEYSDFNYWREELPQVQLDFDEEELEEEETPPPATGGYPFYDFGR